MSDLTPYYILWEYRPTGKSGEFYLTEDELQELPIEHEMFGIPEVTLSCYGNQAEQEELIKTICNILQDRWPDKVIEGYDVDLDCDMPHLQYVFDELMTNNKIGLLTHSNNFIRWLAKRKFKQGE